MPVGHALKPTRKNKSAMSTRNSRSGRKGSPKSPAKQGDRNNEVDNEPVNNASGNKDKPVPGIFERFMHLVNRLFWVLLLMIIIVSCFISYDLNIGFGEDVLPQCATKLGEACTKPEEFKLVFSKLERFHLIQHVCILVMSIMTHAYIRYQ